MFLRLCWLIAAHDVSVRADRGEEEGDTWNAEAPVAPRRARAEEIFMLIFTNRPKIPDINVLYCVLAGVEISTQVACRRQRPRCAFVQQRRAVEKGCHGTDSVVTLTPTSQRRSEEESVANFAELAAVHQSPNLHDSTLPSPMPSSCPFFAALP